MNNPTIKHYYVALKRLSNTEFYEYHKGIILSKSFLFYSLFAQKQFSLLHFYVGLNVLSSSLLSIPYPTFPLTLKSICLRFSSRNDLRH